MADLYRIRWTERHMAFQKYEMFLEKPEGETISDDDLLQEARNRVDLLGGTLYSTEYREPEVMVVGFGVKKMEPYLYEQRTENAFVHGDELWLDTESSGPN